MSDFHEGGWLVYLNGIEVPCPQVSFSYGVGRIPSASLSFPPHRLLQRLGFEDRIEVVVMYLDTLADPANPEFKVCFEGEIIGWAYRNTPFGRTMSFDAIADISVFRELYFYFMNTTDAVVGAAITKGLGADTATEPGAFYPFSLFKKGLLKDPKDRLADIERPFEIVYNVVKGLISNRLPGAQRAIPAANFFARWARKRNFVNRFAALPLFEDDPSDKHKGVFPIFKAVQSEMALNTLQDNLATTIGNAGNIYDVLQHVFGVAFMELVMLPTAPAFRVRLEDGAILGPALSDPSSPDKARQEPVRILNYFVKPQMLYGIAPTCNVIFPSMYDAYSYQENFRTQPTRSYVGEQLVVNLLSNEQFAANTLNFGYPPEIDAVSKDAASTSKTGKNVLVFPEEFYKGPVVHRSKAPSWFTLLQNQAGGTKREGASGEYARLATLYNLYVQYEHMRTRHEKRGGSVDLAFNPYLVPGFPCVVFDSRVSSFDTVGYLLDVNQSFSSSRGAGAMRTTASFGFGRTLQEMFAQLTSDMDRLGVVLGSAPAEPIDQVREIAQDFGKAEVFYNALFHGREELVGRKASFDFRDVVGLKKEDVVEPIGIWGPTATQKPVHYMPGNWVLDPTRLTPMASIPDKPTTNLDSSSDVAPLPGFESLFSSYAEAMRFVSRPICTLSEYLVFVHGGKDLSDLIASGVVEGAGERHGALFYSRIKRLRPGPGEVPSEAITGARPESPPPGGTTGTATPYTGSAEGVPADFPQTRAPWDELLLAYREEMYQDVPQE